MECSLYHRGTGRILQHMTVPPGREAVQATAEHGVVMLHWDAALYHVENGTPKRRQTFPATIDRTEIRADGRDKAVITNLPRPCVVVVDGVPVERKGGTLTLTADVPADYVVTADHWPFLPWSITVRAR